MFEYIDEPFFWTSTSHLLQVWNPLSFCTFVNKTSVM